MDDTDCLTPLDPADAAAGRPGGAARAWSSRFRCPTPRCAPRSRRLRPRPARTPGRAAVLLVPRLDGKYSGFGTVGVIEQVGRLRGGEQAAVVRGSNGPGSAPAPPAPARRCGSRRPCWTTDQRRPRAARTGPGIQGDRGQHPAAAGCLPVRRLGAEHDRPGRAGRPGRLRRLPGQRAEGLAAGDRRRRRAAAQADRLEPGAPGRARRRRDDPQGRPGGHGQAAAGVPAAPAAGRDPQGTGRAERQDRPTEEQDYRARVEAADLPEKVAEAALAEVDKLERTSDQSPEVGWIRTWLDTVLELPWNDRTDDAYDIAERPGGAGRRPRRPGRREGADRRVPGRPAAPAGPWPGRDRWPAQRCGAGAGRTARGGQDLARRVGGPGDGPQLRPGSARRGAGRGRDPRPPADLRRRAARPDRPGDQGVRLDEPGGAAGRGRQARLGLPGRPDRGPARGARPGAEPHLPRPLPRGRTGPVRRAVPGHRQRARLDPGPVAGPDGTGQPGRLHRGREADHRPRSPAAPAAGAGRPAAGRGDHRRGRAAQAGGRVQPGSRRARAGAADRPDPAQGHRRRPRCPGADDAGDGRGRPTSRSTWAGRGTRRRPPNARRCRAWRPGWR